MLKKLIPQQKGFFTYFQGVAEKIVSAAERFKRMMDDLDHAADYAKEIKQDEVEGDKMTRATFDLLHKTFITPFDRYDINQLTNDLDDILDLFNSTAQRITLYQLNHLPFEIKTLADLALRTVSVIKQAVFQLGSLKNADQILQYCVDVTVLEDEADQALLSGVARLFEEEPDIKTLLKVKEVYESVKNIIDKCQDLANIIKGIVLEYA